MSLPLTSLQRPFIFAAAITMLSTTAIQAAQAAPFCNGRIAYSADGNDHDDDDWGATPAGLMMLAAAGWQDKLVHYDYSSHIWRSNHHGDAQMDASALGAAARFGFNKSIFFDAREAYKKGKLATVTDNIAAEINKSSASNPLCFIVAGPMDVAARGIEKSNPSKRKYVTVISHGAWNDEHQHGNSKTAATIKKQGVIFKTIRNQNGKDGFNTRRNTSPWQWMKNSKDQNVRWVYSRMQETRLADISDAGMIWYALTSDEYGNAEKLKNFVTNGTPVSPPITEDNTPDDTPNNTDNQNTVGNGLVILEAESANLTGSSWVLKGTHSAGNCSKSPTPYIRWESPVNHYSSPKDKALSYTFNLEKAGTYTLRAWSCQEPAGRRDENNDVWVSVNDSKFSKFYNTTKGKWGFNFGEEYAHGKINRDKVYRLKKGENTVQISGRSQLFSIDRLVLFQDDRKGDAKQQGYAAGTVGSGPVDDPTPPVNDPTPPSTPDADNRSDLRSAILELKQFRKECKDTKRQLTDKIEKQKHKAACNAGIKSLKDRIKSLK